jgi:hypothetical protein
MDSAPGSVSGVSSVSAGFFVSAVCAWRRTLVDRKRIVEIWRKGIMGLDRITEFSGFAGVTQSQLEFAQSIGCS